MRLDELERPFCIIKIKARHVCNSNIIFDYFKMLAKNELSDDSNSQVKAFEYRKFQILQLEIISEKNGTVEL